MALFGTDMVQVTTPDGRRITVPSQLAAQFPGLSPALPPQQIGMAPLPPQDAGPPIPSAPMPSAFSPQDHADLASASAPPPPTGPQPVTSPGQLPTGGGPNRPQPITAPGQLPDAGAPNTPPPMTNAGLAKLGNAGVYNAESSALDQKTDAVKHAATAEADEYTKVGNAMAARDAEAQRMLEERARIAADNQKSLDDKMTEYQRNAKAIADTKVDRSIDHPILAAIGVALGAIGTAMKHESGNPALDAMYKAIDRKVAAQMQDIDLKKGALGVQRDMIGMQRDAGRDKLAEFDTRRIAGLDQAARQIETIKTQSQSDRVRANSDIALAGIADERAKTLGNAMGREQQRLQVEQQRKDALQMHAQSIGVQYAGQAQAERHFQKTFDENKRQFDIKEANDIKAAMIAAAAKGNKKGTAAYEAAQKENEERAISDPTNGSNFLQPEGEALVKDAVSHEKQAARASAQLAKETDPGKQAALQSLVAKETQTASELRGEASVTHTFRVGKTERDKLSTQVAAAQTLSSTADEIKALREKFGPRWAVTNDGQAMMQSKGVAMTMAMKNAWTLGVLSKSDLNLLNEATGGDPSKLTPGDLSKLFGPEGPGVRLDTLAKGVEDLTRNELRAKGFRGEWKVRRDERPADDPALKESFGQDTGLAPSEAAAGEQRTGAIGRAVDKVGHALAYPVDELEGKTAEGKRAEAQLAQGNTGIAGTNRSYPTLTDKQASFVDARIQAYRQNAGSDDEKKQALADKAAKEIIGLTANQDRPGLTNAVLTALKNEAPELYRRAVGGLPEGQRDAVGSFDQTVQGIQPIGLLRETAIAGDQAARQELARRAAGGDKGALQAIQDVIGARPKWNPAGAVPR